MDDLADRIQQISVEHKQKIEAFEGRGGNRSSKSLLNKDGIFDNPELEERYQKYVQGKQNLGLKLIRFETGWIGKRQVIIILKILLLLYGETGLIKLLRKAILYQYQEVNLENGETSRFL